MADELPSSSRVSTTATHNRKRRRANSDTAEAREEDATEGSRRSPTIPPSVAEGVRYLRTMYIFTLKEYQGDLVFHLRQAIKNKTAEITTLKRANTRLQTKITSLTGSLQYVSIANGRSTRVCD